MPREMVASESSEEEEERLLFGRAPTPISIMIRWTRTPTGISVSLISSPRDRAVPIREVDLTPVLLGDLHPATAVVVVVVPAIA